MDGLTKAENAAVPRTGDAVATHGAVLERTTAMATPGVECRHPAVVEAGYDDIEITHPPPGRASPGHIGGGCDRRPLPRNRHERRSVYPHAGCPYARWPPSQPPTPATVAPASAVRCPDRPWRRRSQEEAKNPVAKTLAAACTAPTRRSASRVCTHSTRPVASAGRTVTVPAPTRSRECLQPVSVATRSALHRFANIRLKRGSAGQEESPPSALASSYPYPGDPNNWRTTPNLRLLCDHLGELSGPSFSATAGADPSHAMLDRNLTRALPIVIRQLESSSGCHPNTPHHHTPQQGPTRWL